MSVHASCWLCVSWFVRMETGLLMHGTFTALAAHVHAGRRHAAVRWGGGGRSGGACMQPLFVLPRCCTVHCPHSGSPAHPVALAWDPLKFARPGWPAPTAPPQPAKPMKRQRPARHVPEDSEAEAPEEAPMQPAQRRRMVPHHHSSESEEGDSGSDSQSESDSSGSEVRRRCLPAPPAQATCACMQLCSRALGLACAVV